MARKRPDCARSLNRRQAMALLSAFGVTTEALAQDAATVAPRSYRVVFENDRVRVRDVTFPPGVLDTGIKPNAAEFGDRLPVVLLDGAEHSYWEVDEPRLRADLTRG